MRYIVTRRYTVTETAEVEADSKEEAIEKFDGIIEGVNGHVDTQHGPVRESVKPVQGQTASRKKGAKRNG